MSGCDYRIRYDFKRVEQGLQRVWQLVAAFVEVAMRRRGPDSLPNSRFLLVVVLCIRFAVDLAATSLYGSAGLMQPLLFAFEVCLFFGFVYIMLASFQLQNRFRQTVVAILGAEIVIALSLLPFALLAARSGQDLLAPPFLYVVVGLTFWMMYVTAGILARALNQPLIVGVGFEIVYLCLILSVEYFLLPDANPVGASQV